MEPIVLVQGGAGEINNRERVKELVAGVKEAAKAGYKVLTEGGSVLDAVEAAVRYMEDNETFNAGKGSVLTLDGEVEMDASIMLGEDLSAGGVTVVKDIQHPISLARLVMERTSHILLAGEGAKRFAVTQGVEVLPEGALVTERTRNALMKYLESQKERGSSHELGTVGAVAMDAKGRLAAATSTGGREGKLQGRCSDTCIIGSGTYADDNIGAVSTTGHGEMIAKFCLAHAIVKSMENGKTANEATNECIQTMSKKLNNTAGAVTLSNKGEVGVGFSSSRMSWCYQRGNKLHFGIDHEEHQIEKL
ncbi:hypothetical protein NQ315_016799 [Exocentrus adspersus]|uniref:Isoaspartyl peptidase/L-asparaginase n=1 Tax=Exocentrus adspersus TaxID=1586481 RepID=A0AAV8VXV6_9CUCU|nr:hypothetical protein NQ315_016799 [Exocentrus adspersus]